MPVVTCYVYVTYPFELTIVLAGQQTLMNPGAGQASFVNQLEIARLKAVQNVVYIDGSYSISNNLWKQLLP